MLDGSRADRRRTSGLFRIISAAIDVVAIAVASVCVVAVLPALLPQLDARLDLLANGVALLAPCGLLALLVVFASRRSRVVIAIWALALLAPSLVIASDMIRGLSFPASKADTAPRIKVISANLWSANPDPAPFLEMVSREQPDVLFLQEAFGLWKPVLEAMAPRYRFVAGCTYPNECNAVVMSGLTRVGDSWPLTSSYAVARLALPDRFGGGAFEVMSVHLSRPPPMTPQRNEIDAMIEITRAFGASAFVAGDFNATPWTGAMRRLDEDLGLDRRTRALFSWPTPLPVAPVDNIYAGCTNASSKASDLFK